MADKDKQPQQKDFDEAQEKVKKDPKSAPRFIDGMPPKEDTPDPKKGMEEGLKAGAMGNTLGKALGMKKGGVIKDLKKAGFYDAKKNKAKRLSIINKVTTKPQRIEMVDKLFSAKKMVKGGSASARADGCAIRGKTKA